MARRKRRNAKTLEVAAQAVALVTGRDPRRVSIVPPAATRSTFDGGILDTSEWLTGRTTPQVALGVDAFYAGVRLIADGVSSAAWGEWRELARLPSSRLARRPMQRMTRREWTWLVAATMAIYNYCPLRLVGGLDNEGVPWSVVPLVPGLLVRDPGSAEYRYGTETISPDEIRIVRRAIFPGLTPELSAVVALARAQIEAAASATAYVGDWWSSGGAPIVMITTDQELDTPQAEAIAARWLARREKGPAYPAVLGKGAKAGPFGTDVAAEDAGQAQDRLIASIARYLGVPAPYINAPSYAGSLTYQNVEQSGLDLVRYTFRAYADPIGDALSDLLPGDYLEGRTIRLDLAALTRGEQAARYSSWGAALAAGWLTINEVRQAEGYPPLDELGQAPQPAPAAAEPAGLSVPVMAQLARS